MVSAMTNKRKDHAAVKFDVAEALGEWMNCLYLKGKWNGDSTYNFIHHRDADGVSGISQLLQEEGHQVLYQPGLKINERPSLWHRLKALKAYINLTKKVPLQWAKERLDRTGIPRHYAMIIFSEEETGKIHHKAKELKVSTNSLLLWALDKVTYKTLLREGSARKWVAPLNMRPDQSSSENPHMIWGNYSASIVTNLFNSPNQNQEEGAKAIHQSIKDYLKNKIHWGSFIYSNMARFIGFKGTLKVAKNIKEVGTGVFSNVGMWPHDGVILNAEKDFYDWRAVLAPSTQILPVAATSWQWKGHMSLTLQLHPSLNQPEDFALELLNQWVKELDPSIESKGTLHNWNQYPECPQQLFQTPH